MVVQEQAGGAVASTSVLEGWLQFKGNFAFCSLYRKVASSNNKSVLFHYTPSVLNIYRFDFLHQL
jgi:hypothetical protein